MRITVVGCGYVGIVTGACLSHLGNHVTCADIDESKVASLARGELPIYEPYLKDMVERAAERGDLFFTTETAQAVALSDVIFIAVGTPPLSDGEANLCHLEAAARSIGSAIDGSRFCIVVNKSTVPVGCGNLVETLVRESIREARPEEQRRIDFAVVSNPEFLREGNAVADSLYPDRIVIGVAEERALEIMRELYRPLLEQSFEPPVGVPRLPSMARPQLLSTTVTSAEMIKYAANAFLAMKISFANEIANICARAGADALEVMTGVGLDSRIGPKFLNPGAGWGGSCFGKDIRALLHTAREYGYEGQLLLATLEVNTAQRAIIIQKLQEQLFVLKGRTIGLLGLAFKPETDDLRDAPSLSIAERLLEMGARVKVYDPIAMSTCRAQRPDLRLQYCESVSNLAVGCDALVIITEWEEFYQLDLVALAQMMSTPILVDGRNVVDRETATSAGFAYSRIGCCDSVRRGVSRSNRCQSEAPFEYIPAGSEHRARDRRVAVAGL